MARSVLRAHAALVLLMFVSPASALAGHASDAGNPIPASVCAALAGGHITAAAFSLPTGGASITSATQVDGPTSFCRVRGEIAPRTADAPPIRFEVDLPATWNGKAVQFGGGGYNGEIPDISSWPSLGLRSAPPPIAQGFLTFGDDSGHQAKDTNDASFARNPEALENYAYMHIKKARDAAFTIARRFYGRSPRRLYFIGGSTGGREALTAALRWPRVYSGVVSNFPTANFVGLRLWGAKLAKVLYAGQSAGWIDPEMVARIASQGRAACDGQDGLTDGLVSDMAACRAGAAARLDALLCRPGTVSDTCLTPAQQAMIQIYHDGFKPADAVRSEVPSFGGYNILEGAAMDLGSERLPYDPLKSGPNAHHAARADQFLRYFIMGDPHFTVLKFDPDAAGVWTHRVAVLAAMINAGSDGWKTFAAAGGKLILVQGLDDVSVSPIETEKLYNGIRSKVGSNRADLFLRFYEVPGLGHGIGHFLLNWDNLGLIDRWVDQGTPPPAEPVGYDANAAGAGRSRPVCPYPEWPKFDDTAPAEAAAAFHCAAPTVPQ